jgi:transcriptional regulator with XRE-family HTH domain
MLLHNWRVANNMGPGDAARLLGVRPITVWRWETGRSMPSAADLRRIIELTGGAVTPNDFFGVQPAYLRPVLDALREAHVTFRHYAEIHAAKPGGLGIKKAEDNAALAGRMGAAITILEGVAP